MKSIRLFLIATLMATITLGVFLAVLKGYQSGTRSTQALLDIQLTDAAALIAVQSNSGAVVTPPPSGRLAFQVWSADGRLLQRSGNAPETPITALTDHFSEENFSGHRWRVLSTIDDNSGRRVLVGERIDLRIELTDRIVIQAVMPMIISLPVIALIVWLVVGNGLSLVRQLANELASKRADDLSQLKTSSPPEELAPVVSAINDLLRRLQASVQRERRFSADAAHELRTPLSALKIHLHNLKEELPEHAAQIQSLDKDLGRLGHLIEQILLLYRMSPEHYQANMQSLDLHALAQRVIAEVYGEIDRRGQSVALAGSSQTLVGDESSLSILLTNLIMNASKYSPTGATITVTVDRHYAGVVLEVRDTGPGIPVAELGQVLGRFYRVGSDRHASQVEGSGLGLSIVQHIAELHQATLTIDNAGSRGGLIVRVIFPDEPDSVLMVPRS